MSRYERGSETQLLRVLFERQACTLPTSDVLQRLGVDHTIRIPQSDYPDLAQSGQVLVHFGLPVYDALVDLPVVLSRVIAFGYFRSSGDEQLPLLSFDHVWIGRIRRTIAHTSYDRLPEDCFVHSIGGARNTSELQLLILSRYKHTLPDLSDEKILAQGISIRYLELLRKTSF